MWNLDDTLSRFATDLIGRLTGPMTFRLILQPLMATLYAVRDGLKDAREGNPPYLRTLLLQRKDRRRLLRDGWKATGRIVLLGTVMDLIYQVSVLRRVYPLELIVVVLLLAFVPYLLVRGPVNRIARARRPSRRRMPTP
jgi:hypothetical protein